MSNPTERKLSLDELTELLARTGWTYVWPENQSIPVENFSIRDDELMIHLPGGATEQMPLTEVYLTSPGRISFRQWLESTEPVGPTAEAGVRPVKRLKVVGKLFNAELRRRGSITEEQMPLDLAYLQLAQEQAPRELVLLAARRERDRRASLEEVSAACGGRSIVGCVSIASGFALVFDDGTRMELYSTAPIGVGLPNDTRVTY